MPDNESYTMRSIREQNPDLFIQERVAEKVEPPPKQTWWDKLKSMARHVHESMKLGPPEALAERASNVGANLKLYKGLNQELSKPGGMTEEEHARLMAERGYQGYKDLQMLKEEMR